MTTRWIVDLDGAGLCAVASEEGGRCTQVYGPAPREKCEQHIQYLRKHDSERGRRPLTAKQKAAMLAGRQRAAAAKREAAGEPPQKPPKPSRVREKVAGKVKHPPPKESPESLDLYAKGFYREPCRKCGKGMKRTGLGGRAPVEHKGGCP